jgi:hypothetical protein
MNTTGLAADIERTPDLSWSECYQHSGLRHVVMGPLSFAHGSAASHCRPTNRECLMTSTARPSLDQDAGARCQCYQGCSPSSQY